MIPGQAVLLSPPKNFREHVARPDFRPSGLMVKRIPEQLLKFRCFLLRAEIGPSQKRGDGFAFIVANAERLGLAGQGDPADIIRCRARCRAQADQPRGNRNHSTRGESRQDVSRAA